MHAVRSGCVPISSAPARTPSTISWGTRCLKHRRRFASSWEREMRIHLEPVFTTVGSANRAPSEQAARAAGLEPQQYLLLLALRGLPEGKQATILTLAERLQLRHHSVVGLIDRLEKRGLVRRVRGKEDRRKVLISLTARGEQIL